MNEVDCIITGLCLEKLGMLWDLVYYDMFNISMLPLGKLSCMRITWFLVTFLLEVIQNAWWWCYFFMRQKQQQGKHGRGKWKSSRKIVDEAVLKCKDWIILAFTYTYAYEGWRLPVSCIHFELHICVMLHICVLQYQCKQWGSVAPCDTIIVSWIIYYSRQLLSTDTNLWLLLFEF